MNTYEEKLNLLTDMIAFAVVDGKLHDKEYLFLSLIAQELKVVKSDFDQLFHQENNTNAIKDDFERIQQFYRLALLMYCDGILHNKENIAIHEIGVKMGFKNVPAWKAHCFGFWRGCQKVVLSFWVKNTKW